MDGGQHLQKVHYLSVRKWTDILQIEEKSTKTANITRCLQDFRKAKAFLADEYFHEFQSHQDQSYFYYRTKCFHSSKVREEPHNLKLALCIVSLLFTRVLCDFIVYTSKGLSVERIMFDQDQWDTLREKVCDYYSKHFLPVAAL